MALTAAHTCWPGERCRCAAAAGVMSARGGDRPGELDAQVVAVALDPGDGRGPRVAGAAVGPVRVQRDGGGPEHDERVTVEPVRGGEAEPVIHHHGVAVGVSAVQVEPDEPGDVVGAGPGGDGRGVAFLHDPAVLDDDEPVGEDERVERVVGDQ